MTQILKNRSLRFFPDWDENNIYQFVGLYRMVDFIFSNNPLAGHWIEIGSYIGESSTVFLANERLKRLDCVDHWVTSEQELHKKFKNEVAKKRCFIHRVESSIYATQVPEESVDVIYIDGDHSYIGAKRDIVSYYPKLKPGGYLCGHDYHAVWPGVIKAVDETAEEKGKKIKVFEDASWVLIP